MFYPLFTHCSALKEYVLLFHILFCYLINHYKTLSYKNIHDWVSGIQLVFNTKPFTSVHFLHQCSIFPLTPYHSLSLWQALFPFTFYPVGTYNTLTDRVFCISPYVLAAPSSALVTAALHYCHSGSFPVLSSKHFQDCY